ncbi:hypothetical protein [Variovorax sp. J31P207]|uniref:hypothetical protein n=1 Tax=Variovorax sp. J31P207 TaxID=3053510 RepID=UPI0025768E25|nr:hypothetical protein [Variovorax sp. J31P207]MDM0065013.1 hypothetical protein [Variovorax sp. J31P207]
MRISLWLRGAIVAAALLSIVGIWLWLGAEHRAGVDDDVVVKALDGFKDRGAAAEVAANIKDNYIATRKTSKNWSIASWSWTVLASALSLFSAFILKLESKLMSESAKKDFAALLAVLATLLIQVGTALDFKALWVANRLASAEIEAIAYQFLRTDGADPKEFYDNVGQTLHRKNQAIVGKSQTP